MRLAMIKMVLAPLLLALGLVPAGLPDHSGIAAPCAARVAMLGADMSAGGRFEVQRALAVGPHTRQLDETLTDERLAAHGLVPPDLLGVVAVSSALLQPLPAGSGLAVRLNQAITLDTAQTYANALLTAGITAARVGVAAPTSQQALGTTALLGLLRAARVACVAISPRREDLAIREVVLTSELAREIGRQAAPSLMFALKSDAVAHDLLVPADLEALVTRDAAARGLTVPRDHRAGLVAFLHDLVASGSYAGIAAAHPSIGGAGLRQVTVRLAGTAVKAAPRVAPAVRSPSRAAVWLGTVVAVAASGVALHRRDGVHDFRLAPALRVYRNGQVSSITALQPGDAVTVTTNGAGLATLVRAASPAVPATPSTTASGSGNAAAIAVLAALLLLALLLVPLLVGLLRRRRAHAIGMALPGHSGGVRPFIFTAKGAGRARLKRGRRGRADPDEPVSQ